MEDLIVFSIVIFVFSGNKEYRGIEKWFYFESCEIIIQIGLKLWEEINVSCVKRIGSENEIRFELNCICESKKIIIKHTQDKKWFDFDFKITFFLYFLF